MTAQETAQDLVQRLQVVLGLNIRTGQIVLTLRNSELETFEARTVGKLRPKREPGVNGVDEHKQIAHTTT